MWKDIKEILFDFLKGFRWYLLFIPFFIILFILSKFNLTFGMVTVLVALLFLLFVPFIFAFGTILSFICLFTEGFGSLFLLFEKDVIC